MFESDPVRTWLLQIRRVKNMFIYDLQKFHFENVLSTLQHIEKDAVYAFWPLSISKYTIPQNAISYKDAESSIK